MPTRMFVGRSAAALAAPFAAFLIACAEAREPAAEAESAPESAVGVLAAPPSSPAPAPDDGYVDEIGALAADARVVRAFEIIEELEERTHSDLIMLTEIPAPPFMEEERARKYAEMLAEAGADSVYIDEEGNTIALRRGRSADGRAVAIAGHLDTVFPEATDVTVRVRGDTLFAPGIGDDTRGLIVVLTVLRALNAADVATDADILFVGTVGEEGLGDLRGVKHLFRDGGPRIDSFIAVDGGGDAGITNGALGSRRYRVTFRGPGGHSWGAFGLGNPAHALARAVARFDDAAAAFVAEGPRTSYNVGRIGGGTSVNSIPFEAWMEVDMRSVDPGRLVGIDSVFHTVMGEALEEQNERRQAGEELHVDIEQVGDRPSGMTDPSVPLLQRALAVTQHFGREAVLGTGSTDSNVPISLGIPAITIGRGGVGGNAHALDEWWLNEDGHIGIQRALLILLAEAGLAD